MVKTITIMKSSTASPAAEGQLDKDRRLSPEGVELADRRRVSLGDKVFDLGLVSDRRSAYETIRCIAGPRIKTFFRPRLFELANPEQQVAFDRVHSELGGSPLRTYLDYPDIVEIIKDFCTMG